MPVRNPTGQPLGPNGENLVNITLPGDGHRHKHDSVKWNLVEALDSMSITTDVEVYNIFASVMNPDARDSFNNHPYSGRQKQGLVPDIKANLPNPISPETLIEIKGITLGAIYSNPPNIHADTPRYATSKRASTINHEYITKAKKLDQLHHNANPDDIGPVEQKLRSYGQVLPATFGHFGEINKEFTTLLQTIAMTGATRDYRNMFVNTPTEASGILMWQLQRRIGSCIQNANATFMESRLQFVTAGAAAARGRRQRAQAQFYGRNQDPSLISDQFHSHSRESYNNYARERFGF
eukprot:m.33404 g.33404  ORF g.33404 m.33404 type:complete len:294 (-) comp16814_c0_seq1:25-906(-)